MRSIRLSLVIYFTLLLAAAVGSVFWFYYRDIQQSVESNRTNTTKLIETQYKENERQARTVFDDHLVRRAHLMATLARPNLYMEGLYILGHLSTAPGPLSHLPAASWWEHVANRRLVQEQFDLRLPPMHFAGGDEVIAPTTGDDADEFLQIYRGDGKVTFRSDSMDEDSFQLDDKQKKDIESFPEDFDELELRQGLKVRRVTIKVAVQRPRTVLIPLPPPANQKPKSAVAAKKPQQPAPFPPYQVLYVQYAAKKDPLDQKLAKLKSDYDSDLTGLDEKSAAALASMHNRLIWLSLATVCAIIIGSMGLVRLGLKPLDKLSEAVSKVSERNMRLDFPESKLPRELQPIVDRLQQTLELLKRAFRREKQAAADISHELRTPLAALLTTLNVALRKERSPEEYRETLVDCRASGQQMTQLVERMLTLARLDSGVDQIRPREVDVEGLADQCASLVRPLAEARGVTLRVHHHGPAPLNTDPDKLREVLTNLLHNAIEYNKPDGSIDVDIERTNGQLRVEVRDTGIGISPEARQQIFERFYRADPSRQADGLHAGIGLAIVKGYVELMGGDIEVDSIVGQGSTFRLSLPVHLASRAGALASSI